MRKRNNKNGKGGNSLAYIQRYFPKVKSVDDHTEPEIIEVTRADNAHGDVKSHRTCALAIACKRFFKADGVIIGLTASWIIVGTKAFRLMNSATLAREIMSFDRKAGFDPGFYHMTPASPSNKLGLQRSFDPDRRAKNKGTKKAFRHFTRNVRTTLGRYGMPSTA